MDEASKKILKLVNLEADQLNDSLIQREIFLDINKYEEIKPLIPELKNTMNSRFFTALHNDADEKQRWPLLNLIRQILLVYKYKMEPIRKCDGYTGDNKKRYKRYFLITKTTEK